MFISNVTRYPGIAAVGILAVAVAVSVWTGASEGVGVPSASTTPTPSASQQPLRWHPGAWLADWPAAVRVEPADGSFTLTRVRRGVVDFYPLVSDLTGDAGESAPAWVDIRGVQFRVSNAARIGLNLVVSTVAPTAADAWIAYGIVLDTDGDGRPDIRAGADNARSASEHRAWMTNLNTGETSVGEGPDVGAFGVEIDTWYIGNLVDDTLAEIRVYRPDRMAFYAWSGLIVDGVLVATDYAPDAGWLESTFP